MVDEGPFVDITGTYDDVRKQPVFKVDRVYKRRDPIFQIVLPGGLEHYLLMGLPREPAIFKSVNQVVPLVHGVRLTEGGCCWLHGVVSITKNKEGDAVNAIMAAFTGHPSLKKVIIVDEDVDIYDDRQVEWAVATRFQAHRGLLVVNNAAGSSLDPSAGGTTSKVGIDATKPIGSKAFDLARLD
jgi:UbiD family decarboxylase